jgi:hypothetical protein
MGVSLYDNPAQATFVNTYVPIKFDSLYKLADQDRADFKEAEAKLDELASMRNLNSYSKAGNDAYAGVYNEIAGKSSELIKDSTLLMNPENRRRLNSMKRSLVNDPRFSTLIENKKRWDSYVQKEDPRWGGLALDEVNAADPYKLWDKQNMAFEDPQKYLEEKLPETQIGEPRKVGNGVIATTFGVSKEQVEQLAQDKSGMYGPGTLFERYAQMEKKLGQPSYYRHLDKNGNFNGEAWVAEKTRNANWHQIYKKEDYHNENRQPGGTRISIGGPKIEEKPSYIKEVGNDVDSQISAKQQSIAKSSVLKLATAAQKELGLNTYPNYDQFIRTKSAAGKGVSHDGYVHALNEIKLSSLQSRRKILADQRSMTGNRSYDDEIKSIDKSIDNLASALNSSRDGWNDFTSASFSLAGTKNSLISATDAAEGTKVTLPNHYVSITSKAEFGEPTKTEFVGSKVEAYTPKAGSQFTMVDKLGGLEAKNKKAASEKISAGMKAGSLDGSGQFIPSQIARKTGGDKDGPSVKIYGYMKYAESALAGLGLTRSALTGEFPSFSAKDKRKTVTSGFREEVPTKSGIETYYYIPVALDKDISVAGRYSGGPESKGSGEHYGQTAYEVTLNK